MSRTLRMTLGTMAMIAVVAGFSAPSATADTTYPSNTTFNDGAQGWTDATHGCSLLGLLPNLLCTTSNQHSAGTGNPPGSLQSSYQTIANVLGLATGEAVWRSDAFTIAATSDAALTGAIMSLDRKSEIQALVDLGGEAATTVVLVDESNNNSEQVLLTETLTEAEGTFTNRAVAVPKSRLVRNHKYRLEVRTAFASTLLQAANGSIDVFYDNIRLRVADGTDTGNVVPVVETLLATDLTADAATLNGAVNPKGLQTDYNFLYRKAGTQEEPTPTPVTSAGSGTALTTQSFRINGLAQCTTYEYRIQATNAVGQAFGQNSVFETDCPPDAITLPAAPVGVNEAGLNSSVRPNGPASSYHYDISVNADMSGANSTPERLLGGGRSTFQPNTETVAGLPSNTTFFYRVVATNNLGATIGNVVSFKTGVPTGPGAPGAPGATGPRGPASTGGTGNITIGSGDERALLRIRTALVKVGTVGRRRGQIRMAIFCRKRTGRTCAGTVKLRTVNRINPSARRRKAKRRVTFATFEYQLAQGKRGFAISNLTPEKLELIEKIKSVAIDISVQVTDSGGNRQTIVRRGRLRAFRTV